MQLGGIGSPNKSIRRPSILPKPSVNRPVPQQITNTGSISGKVDSVEQEEMYPTDDEDDGLPKTEEPLPCPSNYFILVDQRFQNTDRAAVKKTVATLMAAIAKQNAIISLVKLIGSPASVAFITADANNTFDGQLRPIVNISQLISKIKAAKNGAAIVHISSDGSLAPVDPLVKSYKSLAVKYTLLAPTTTMTPAMMLAAKNLGIVDVYDGVNVDSCAITAITNC